MRIARDANEVASKWFSTSSDLSKVNFKKSHDALRSRNGTDLAFYHPLSHNLSDYKNQIVLAYTLEVQTCSFPIMFIFL